MLGSVDNKYHKLSYYEQHTLTNYPKLTSPKTIALCLNQGYLPSDNFVIGLELN